MKLASFISPGTERWQILNNIDHGYMTLIKKDNKFQILPVAHNKEWKMYSKDLLFVNSDFNCNIEQLMVARFMLVAASSLDNYHDILMKNTRLIIVGSGSIAVSLYLELCRMEFENISFFYENERINKILTNTKIGQKNLEETEVRIAYFYCRDNFDNFDEFLKEIPHFSCVFILGSPRKPIEMDLYYLHKKGISLFGAHELLSSRERRQDIFNNLCKYNEGKDYSILCQSWHSTDIDKIKKSIEQRTFEKPFNYIVYE